ncbi:hypothetical protein [Methylobacterium radiodurans]|uniref:Uncharacterized protein n=1 Tax=Methylobacterium radiodurans TaxID=2202828 RepID=A0A2U8VUT6_9HYPH|nr:hypothetical protein [Methylobacterium radiodurans]AWN36896.1 hypothetical protein DK427_15100 [Methylobacterium radiodurans]
MSALREKRAAIAGAVAAEGRDGAETEARVAALLAGRAEPETAELRHLLTEYRDLEALPADEADVRLAEQGEVFAREDDA